MAKTKWPKLPRFFVPLFHCANVYLWRSREEWDAACIHLGVEAGGSETLVGCCRQYQNIGTNENIYLKVSSTESRRHLLMSVLMQPFTAAMMLA